MNASDFFLYHLNVTMNPPHPTLFVSFPPSYEMCQCEQISDVKQRNKEHRGETRCQKWAKHVGLLWVARAKTNIWSWDHEHWESEGLVGHGLAMFSLCAYCGFRTDFVLDDVMLVASSQVGYARTTCCIGSLKCRIKPEITFSHVHIPMHWHCDPWPVNLRLRQRGPTLSISVQELESLECHQLQVVWMSLLTCQLFILCAMAKRRPFLSQSPKAKNHVEVSLLFVKVVLCSTARTRQGTAISRGLGDLRVGSLSARCWRQGNDRGEGPFGHLSHGRSVNVAKIYKDRIW